MQKKKIAHIENIIFMNKQNIPWKTLDVKANAAQIIGEMIVLAENKRWVENKDKKHAKDAEKGWYRYDCYLAIKVQGSNEAEERMNFYKATLVVRSALSGMYLYDIINIKKEASTPLESN